MKRIMALVLVALFVCSVAYAGHVNGYTRKDGTYVQGYERSDPDSTVRNNYNYAGNTNPSTGAVGTNHYRNNPTSEYFGTSSTRSNNNAFGSSNDE
jgi:hypothetical protein